MLYVAANENQIDLSTTPSIQGEEFSFFILGKKKSTRELNIWAFLG